MTIVGMSGSLRKNSFNAGLLRAAAEVVSPGTNLETLSIRDIPLFDGDIEDGSGIPASVQQIKDRTAAADGLLLVTPEYNNSIPGVFKNAIDWMSRPATDIPFGRALEIGRAATPAAGKSRDVPPDFAWPAPGKGAAIRRSGFLS